MTHALQQQATRLHREYLIAPNTPKTRVVAPPMIASMSAVLDTTFPIYLGTQPVKWTIGC